MKVGADGTPLGSDYRPLDELPYQDDAWPILGALRERGGPVTLPEIVRITSDAVKNGPLDWRRAADVGLD